MQRCTMDFISHTTTHLFILAVNAVERVKQLYCNDTVTGHSIGCSLWTGSHGGFTHWLACAHQDIGTCSLTRFPHREVSRGYRIFWNVSSWEEANDVWNMNLAPSTPIPVDENRAPL